ncbi:MAG: ABC transporter ATP-binding protein [Pirellulaceae bacterium]
MTPAPLIVADALSKSYGQSGQHVIRALDGVSLSVLTGERVAVVGKSGSGKSTLLNLLAGLDRPTAGSLKIDGRQLDRFTRNEMARYRCQTVGIIFQSFQLLPQRTALQNVELPLMLSGVPSRRRRLQALEWLDRVGLASRAAHLPYALSGGEQQRVAIARALVHHPRLLLADEPTGNLDSVTADQIQSLLLDLCSDGSVTFVLVTHDDHLASRCCNRTVAMGDGKLMEGGHDAIL